MRQAKKFGAQGTSLWMLLIFTTSLSARPTLAGPQLWSARALTRQAAAWAASSPDHTLAEDPALAVAMERHLDLVLEDEWRATPGELEAALRTEGLADAQILPFVSLGRDPEVLSTALERFATDVARSRGMTHVGVALRARGERRAVAALFSRRIVELAPLPRALAPGPFRLRGRAVGLRALEAMILGPCSPSLFHCTEETRKIPHRFEDDVLSVPIEVTRPGRYVVELLAARERGPEVAAFWTFTVGTGGPADPKAGGLDRTDAWARAPGSASAREAEVRRLVEEARRSRELPGLAPSLALARAAEGQATAVCQSLIAAHVTPETGSPETRAARAGYAGWVAENIAIAPSLERAHANLLRSPSHRANVLDPGARVAGYGVSERTVAGETTICVVQLFGREPAPPGQGR